MDIQNNEGHYKNCIGLYCTTYSTSRRRFKRNILIAASASQPGSGVIPAYLYLPPLNFMFCILLLFIHVLKGYGRFRILRASTHYCFLSTILFILLKQYKPEKQLWNPSNTIAQSNLALQTHLKHNYVLQKAYTHVSRLLIVKHGKLLIHQSDDSRIAGLIWIELNWFDLIWFEFLIDAIQCCLMQY